MTSPTDAGIRPDMKQAIIELGRESYIQGANDTLDLLKETAPAMKQAILSGGLSEEAAAQLTQLTPAQAYEVACNLAFEVFAKTIETMRRQDMKGASNDGGSK